MLTSGYDGSCIFIDFFKSLAPCRAAAVRYLTLREGMKVEREKTTFRSIANSYYAINFRLWQILKLCSVLGMPVFTASLESK